MKKKSITLNIENNEIPSEFQNLEKNIDDNHMDNDSIKSNNSIIEFKDFSKDFQSNWWNCCGEGNHNPSGPGFNNKKGCNEEELPTHVFQKLFLQPTSTGKNPEHCIFELIKQDVKVKPFYDIDKGFDSKEECDKNEKILLDSFTNYLMTIYPLGVLSISTATGWKTKYYTKDKIKHTKLQYSMSYHIVVNNYETTLLENAEFNVSHKIYEQFDFVDKAIYRDKYGLLRCLYANKPWEIKSPRFKVIYENDNPLTHLIQSNKDTNIGFNKIEYIKKKGKKKGKKKTIKIKIEKEKPEKSVLSNTLKEKEDESEEEDIIYPELKLAETIETLFKVTNKWTCYPDIIACGMAFFNACDEMNELDSGKIAIAEWMKRGTLIWKLRDDRSVEDWDGQILTFWDYWTKRTKKTDDILTYGSLKYWAAECEIKQLEEGQPPNIKYKQLSDINKKYLELIPCNKDTYWKIASVLKRIGCSQKDFDEWSKTSEDYEQKNNDIRWLDVEKYNFNEKTLFFEALKHKKEETQDIKNSIYDNLVMTYMKNQTEYEMSRLLRNYIQNIYCIDNSNKATTFIIPNEYNKWETKNKAQLGKFLSEEVYQIFMDKIMAENNTLKKMKGDLILINEKEEPDKYKKQKTEVEDFEKNVMKPLNVNARKLQTQSCKGNFINALVDNTFDPKIMEKLDETNLYLINFDNGAYDLKNSRFIIPEPEDFVLKSTNFNYESEIDEEIRLEIFSLLNKIYKDETDETTELRDYNLKLIASALCGINKYEGFYVLSGCGGNGKGIQDTLNSFVFGEYYDVIDKSFFTTQKKTSGGADPELAGKKGIRMLVSSECEKAEVFQANKLKILSGNDNISTRGLFQEQFKFVPQFTIFIQSNGSPNLSQVDKAVKRRFRLIEHPTQFVNNPDKENRYEEKKDSSLKEKFRNDVRYRQQFMLILIEYYNKYIRDDTSGEIRTPDMVKEYTDDFIYDNDVIGQFFFENGIKVTNNKKHRVKQNLIWDIYNKCKFNEEVQKMYKPDLYKLVSNYEGIRKVRQSDGHYFVGLKLDEETLNEILS